MRIGIVSDTHGHLGNTRKAVEALAAHEVECVLHCGDIGSSEVVPLFGRWPTHFVFGNCDHDEDALTETIELSEQTSHGAFGSIELDGCRIALIHGHDSRRFREAIASQEFGLVCYGHTHVPEHHYEGETLVLNPGALFRATPHTIAVVDLPSLAVRSIEVA
jgi:putative phosphoesterase